MGVFRNRWFRWLSSRAHPSVKGLEEMAGDTTENEVGAHPERVGAWATGFHGAVAGADLQQFAGVSVRDVALARRSSGAGSLDALTDLPETQAARDEPTGADGRRHVGVNRLAAEGNHPVAAAPAARDEVAVVARPTTFAMRGVPDALDAFDALDAADESTEAFVERRLEQASFVFLPNRSRAYAVTKRTIDLVGASVLLVVFTPVMLVLGLIIRLDSPGPALFVQERVTRGGRHFRFYKFRTMYADARERFPELYAYRFTDSQFDEAYYKLADDPRNTRFGAWLRRTTLDELPNLLNVWKGDLSLVGPRPELPELVRYYRPEELACFFTKAGLTGLAQVAGRSLLTVRERLTLDLRYVAHQTLLLDLRILWRTVIVVVLRRGAF